MEISSASINNASIVAATFNFIDLRIVIENVDFDLVDGDRRDLVDDTIVDTDVDRVGRHQITEVIVTGSDQNVIIKDYENKAQQRKTISETKKSPKESCGFVRKVSQEIQTTQKKTAHRLHAAKVAPKTPTIATEENKNLK